MIVLESNNPEELKIGWFARHLHRTDVLREQVPASRAYSDCTVPSTHLPAVGSYMIRMKTSQKQARKTCKVNILHTQCIYRVLRSSFLQRTACTPPLVVSFQWETRDLYTLVCLDQECYDECQWINLSRGYLTWADTSNKPTTCQEAPHIALRTSQFAIFWRNQPMSGLQTVIKMKKSKRFKMTVQKSPLRPMSAHT